MLPLFEEFESECIKRGYKPKKEHNDKLFYVKSNNGIKSEIKQAGKQLKYVFGYQSSNDEIKLMQDLIISLGFEFSPNMTNIHIHVDEISFVTFFNLITQIEKISGIVAPHRRKYPIKRNNNKDEIFIIMARHFYNCIKEGTPCRVSRCGGLFDAYDDMITLGYSVDGLKQEKLTGVAYREHIVPCFMIEEMALSMFNDNKTIDDVANMIQRNLGILCISDEEQQLIDFDLGYRTTMPSNWEDGDNIFARIDEANISYIKSTH